MGLTGSYKEKKIFGKTNEIFLVPYLEKSLKISKSLKLFFTSKAWEKFGKLVRKIIFQNTFLK